MMMECPIDANQDPFTFDFDCCRYCFLSCFSMRLALISPHSQLWHSARFSVAAAYDDANYTPTLYSVHPPSPHDAPPLHQPIKQLLFNQTLPDIQPFF